MAKNRSKKSRYYCQSLSLFPFMFLLLELIVKYNLGMLNMNQWKFSRACNWFYVKASEEVLILVI